MTAEATHTFKLQQQEAGKKYSGSITTADGAMSLDFLISVDNLEKFNNFSPDSIQQLREEFKIQIQKKDSHTDIELSDDEYVVFFQIIFPPLWDFYKSPQTEDTNSGFMMEELLKPGSHLSKTLGSSASIGIENEISITGTGEQILQREKFR